MWDRDWTDLQGLDAAYRFDSAHGFPMRGTGVRIPLLEEVLAAFPQCLLNLDLKQPGMEDLLAAELARLGAEDRVLVGSFHDRRLTRFCWASGGRVATSAGPAEVLAVSERQRAWGSPSAGWPTPTRCRSAGGRCASWAGGSWRRPTTPGSRCTSGGQTNPPTWAACSTWGSMGSSATAPTSWVEVLAKREGEMSERRLGPIVLLQVQRAPLKVPGGQYDPRPVLAVGGGG